MEKVMGKNGLLKNKKSKRYAKFLVRKKKAEFKRRKDLLLANPEKAEAERKMRVEKYLMGKKDSINVPTSN